MIRTITATIIAALTLLVGLTVAPAAQAEADPWAAHIAYPLYRKPGNTHTNHRVVIETPNGPAWGIRRVARAIDKQVPGLRIFTRGGCEARPAAVCIRVTTTLDTRPGAWRAWAWIGRPTERPIEVNTSLAPSVEVVAHELGHALGLGHHRSPGLTTTGYSDRTTHLAADELDALRAWFAVPRHL